MAGMICASCTETVELAESCPRCGAATALDGRYRLLEVVGHGAQGTTYRALRLRDDRELAIKELLVRKLATLKSLELFEREAEILRQLDHPAIPGLVESFSVEAPRSLGLYLVQEFIAGPSLAAEAEQKRYRADEVLEIVEELLEVLGYLGTLSPPVVHRDLKPANVLRRASDGRLVLVDFGAVRAAMDSAEGGSTVAGTFGYMAPEQFMGRATPATDIYGLGALALSLLSRRDPQELLGSDRSLQVPAELGLAPEIADLLQVMLAAVPEARPQDARELQQHIRDLRDGKRVTALAPVARNRALEVPAAPRAISLRQAGELSAPVRFQRTFGALFGGIGGGLGLVWLIVGLVSGALPLVLFSLLFVLGFGGVGGALFARGSRQRRALQRLHRDGQMTRGEVVEVGRSAYSVNRQRAHMVNYRYTVQGTLRRGKHGLWEPPGLRAGDAVAVLYDPQRPDDSILYLDPDLGTLPAREG